MRRLGAAPPGRRPAARHRQHAPRLHPADARRPRVRRTGVRDAARRTQLLEQHRVADHLPARGLRADRDAPHASQSRRRRRCAPSPRVDAFAGEHGRLLRDPGEFRRHRAPRPRVRSRRATARVPWTCRPAARRVPTRRPARAPRPACRRPHHAVDGISVRPVSRLDLRASAAGRARLAGAARPSRTAARGRERRQRAGRASRRATRNGPACANSATAIRRARWPGRRTRAAAACW